jgi:hypothetical protein
MEKTLLIYGSFSAKNALRAVSNWSCTHVLEIDAHLPSHYREKCAGITTLQPMFDAATGQAIFERADDLMDAFLADRVEVHGVEAGRSFRSVCQRTDAWRMIMPHLVCVNLARKIAEYGPWNNILIAPGVGVSLKAFSELAQAHAAKVRVLPFDRQKPPFLWKLRRRLKKIRRKALSQITKNNDDILPIANREGGLWCTVSAFEKAFAYANSKGVYFKPPVLSEPSSECLALAQSRYSTWWQSWWQDWQKAHQNDPCTEDHWILGELGAWQCEHIYPRYSLWLEEARNQISKWQPKAILVGSMPGWKDLLWALAARERNIQVFMYTVDCHVNPRLSFRPDTVFCDDLLQYNSAVKYAGEPALYEIQCVRSHRSHSPQIPIKHSRKRILFADTFYSGMTGYNCPFLSDWAYELVVSVARAMPDIDFFIKFHPIREAPEQRFHLSGLHHLTLWMKEKSITSLKPPANLSTLAPEIKLSDELANTDLLLNLNSYAVYEAFACKIPVINLQPEGSVQIYPHLRKHGALLEAGSAQDVISLILRLFEDETFLMEHHLAQKSLLDAFYFSEAPPITELFTEQAVKTSQHI